MANEKVKRFGTRELDRFERSFASQFIEAKEGGAKKRVRMDSGEDGSVRITPA